MVTLRSEGHLSFSVSTMLSEEFEPEDCVDLGCKIAGRLGSYHYLGFYVSPL